MDAASIPKLTHDTLEVLRDIFVGIARIFERKGLSSPVIQASQLSFRANGMRRTLERIASGEGNNQDITDLRIQLETTDSEVGSIVGALDQGWNRLIRLPGGLEIATEIGNLIHSPIGKMGIRVRIAEIIRSDPKNDETVRLARQVCDDIDRFNEGLVSLHNRILKPASDLFQKRG